jgi:iron complex transport system ATP-binding protein
MSNLLLEAKQLSLQQGARLLCKGLNLQVHRQQMWLVLGQNGSGKSTLLSALAGWQSTDTGEIRIAGQLLHQLQARQRAKQLAWMPQHDQHPFPISVLEQVLTGCHARLSRFAWESQTDHAQAQAWLEQLDLAGFAHQEIATLSGGEQRRVALATALMQQTPLLLLDEPLSQLDLHHQQQTLQLLKRHCQQGHSVMMVSHDPNHARHCTHALLLFGDGRWLAGRVDEVCTASHLSELYQTTMIELSQDHHRWFVMV